MQRENKWVVILLLSAKSPVTQYGKRSDGKGNLYGDTVGVKSGSRGNMRLDCFLFLFRLKRKLGKIIHRVESKVDVMSYSLQLCRFLWKLTSSFFWEKEEKGKTLSVSEKIKKRNVKAFLCIKQNKYYMFLCTISTFHWDCYAFAILFFTESRNVLPFSF